MAPDDPWLSVLVPVFNGAASLAEALASVAAEAEADRGIEVILVDQGSSDDGLAVAEGFADRINLRIESAPDNRNWMQNTNLALKLARAPVATMLHQDDLWRPGRGQRARAQLANQPGPKLWVSAADYIDVDGRRIGRFAPPFGSHADVVGRDRALGHILVQNTIALPAALFDVAAARAAGGLDEALWYTADWNLWLELAAINGIGWDPAVTAAFRLHGASQTVQGSRDRDDFKGQLDLPVTRHLAKLPTPQRNRVSRLARLSNAVNCSLAARYHGQRGPLFLLAVAYLRLGPAGWGRFLSSSQIIQRSLPRLRALRRRTG